MLPFSYVVTRNTELCTQYCVNHLLRLDSQYCNCRSLMN
ncbi:Glucan endo-1 [Psidium guajava]|nr:Glucan endo-1 [Psidium guajava]